MVLALALGLALALLGALLILAVCQRDALLRCCLRMGYGPASGCASKCVVSLRAPPS
jgi:hypothetical protein